MFYFVLVLLLSVTVHLLLIIYGEWQDSHFDVKYTDVDYSVFTDAANFVVQGRSPFARHTYRYTPLLAYMMVPNVLLHRIFGKILFSFFNIATGFVIFLNCRNYLPKTSTLPLVCAASWWLNPMTFTVSTRGNAESLMTFLVIGSVYQLNCRRYFMAGMFYGFSVHFKLYPVLYTLPLFIHLSFRSEKQVTLRNALKNVFMPNKNLRNFVLASFLTFIIPTIFSYWKYPREYHNEAILYHLSRRDVRHNFSPYFYLLYLTDEWSNDVFGILLFLPQLLLFISIAVKYSYGNDIVFSLFCETFIFVMFNKVCTSQYFLWFLCLLSLLLPHFKMSIRKVLMLLLFWFCGQAIWLGIAYRLEFKGDNVFIMLWAASILFFAINCSVLSQIVRNYSFNKYKTR